MAVRDLIPWRSQQVTTGERYDPFLTFHREMNRLFDDVFRGFGSFGRLATPLLEGQFSWPHIELNETEKTVTVSAELPGLSEEDVQVEIANGVLSIRGERKVERDNGGRYSERYYGAFERRIPLEGVHEDKAVPQWRAHSQPAEDGASFAKRQTDRHQHRLNFARGGICAAALHPSSPPRKELARRQDMSRPDRLMGSVGTPFHAVSHYNSPTDVLYDAAPSPAEKRVILSSRASDMYAVDCRPALREVPGVAKPMHLKDILAALRQLDKADERPRGDGAPVSVPAQARRSDGNARPRIAIPLSRWSRDANVGATTGCSTRSLRITSDATSSRDWPMNLETSVRRNRRTVREFYREILVWAGHQTSLDDLVVASPREPRG